MRAVPLFRRARCPSVPVRVGHRRRAAAAVDREERRRTHRMGRAQPAGAGERAAERGSACCRPGAADEAGISPRLPAGVREHGHRHAGRLPHRGIVLQRRSSPPARSGVRAGVGRNPQRHRVRSDARGVADRPAHRPSQHALRVQAPHAGAGAHAAAGRGGVAAGAGPERVQGHQRHLGPQCRRSRVARGRDRAARADPAV